jgi:hypothetical protein
MKEYYSKINNKIIKARKNFSLFIDEMPELIKELANKYTTYRNKTQSTKGYLGELYAFWLSEPFQLDEEIVQKATLGSITGSLYFVLQDDLIDDPLEFKDSNIYLLSNFLFSEMIHEFQFISDNNKKFWEYMKNYLYEYSIGCIWQSNRRQLKMKPLSVKSFTKKDLFMLAHRSAPIKICMTSIILAAKREDLKNKLEKAIDYFLIGLQIRDDITDWREDLKRGYITYPISVLLLETQRQLGINFPDTFDEEKLENNIEIAFQATDLLENLLEESNYYMLKAKELAKSLKLDLLNSYINYNIEENTVIKNKIISKKIDFIYNNKYNIKNN